jgi:8-oxo-dGTP diphosphatase
MSGRRSSRAEEASWLRTYDAGAFPPFTLTVDLVVFTMRDKRLCVLLVERAEHPFRGSWALPGGHVQHGRESADDAAMRELREETGIDDTDGIYLEQLATYSEPRRDPRIRSGLQVASVAYVAMAADLPEPVAGTDAAQARWWPVDTLDLQAQRRCWRSSAAYEGESAPLAFDHAVMTADALDRISAKLEYTTLAAQFVTEPFSLADLRHVYLAVWGEAPDLANFRRKVLSTPGFVVPVERARRATTAVGGRPASLYRRGDAAWITPPMARSVSRDTVTTV